MSHSCLCTSPYYTLYLHCIIWCEHLSVQLYWIQVVYIRNRHLITHFILIKETQPDVERLVKLTFMFWDLEDSFLVLLASSWFLLLRGDFLIMSGSGFVWYSRVFVKKYKERSVGYYHGGLHIKKSDFFEYCLQVRMLVLKCRSAVVTLVLD